MISYLKYGQEAHKVADTKHQADKQKSLEIAIAGIEKQFGKGAVMRLGSSRHLEVEVIPTGSVALDYALGVGGLPRGRVRCYHCATRSKVGNYLKAA